MKFYLIGSFFLFALLARSCFAAVYISPTQGNDSTGDGTVGNPYLSLQKAISSAPAGSNIDILCQPGVYFYQNNSNLVITAGTVSISPTVTGVCEFLLYHSAGEVFFMNAIGPTASLVLTNLEITGGTSLSNGGLISATGGATVVAHFVTFANGTAVNYGGLVYLATSAGSSFSNCQFFHGVTTAVASAGGAVSAFNTDVTFLGCNFTSNSAERGGAVQISNQQGAINYAQSPTFTACSFLNNAVSPAAPNNAASSVSGGALQIDALPSSQSVQLISTNFDGNKAETSSGGGVFVGTGASATSNNCVFRNHKAHIGGAVYAETAEWVSTNTDYFANTATHINDETSGQGGAIAVHTGFLTLNGCLFESNTAGTNGGAVSHYGGAGHLSNPLPQDLTNITACNFVTNVATNGGGLYLFGLYNVISVAGTNWIQNRATGTGLQSGGGAIFASTAPVQVTYNSFENNTAEVGMGGGMYVALAAGSAVSDRSPSVATSTFQFNRAATGGGVCLDGLGNNTNGMAFLSSRFAQNSAICTSCAASTGVEGFGGGLMVYNTSVISTSTVFFDNFASLRGGAFYAAGDVPLTATVSAAYFFGNQISADSTFGGITAIIGGQATVYINNANETLDTSDGYQVVVADDAVFSLVITNPEGQQTGPCVFSGLAARGNAQVNVNCSMSIDNLDLEDQAGINLNTVASLSINKNIVWRGGGFKCTSLGSESNSIIYFRSSAKGTASLSNSRSKYLNACNFASTGTLLVQNFPGGQLTDLELYGHINPEIFNYGKLIFVGDVVLNNEGQVAASLQSDGEVRIESTLSLTGRSAPFNFIGVSTRNAAAPYFTIFLQNHNASFGTTDALQKSDTHIPTYTALKISGDFYPQGNFQVIVPDFWKGTWTSLVTYSSRSGKFLTKRILVPGDPDEEIPDYESYKMKVKYNSKSIDCSVAKSQSSMTGGQVFGVIFGVLLAVVLIAGIAFYFYRRQHGTTTFDGEVYETINQPRYGTTD